MKKKTKKEVRGNDFNKAPPIRFFSDNLVTLAMINAEIRTFMKKYISSSTTQVRALLLQAGTNSAHSHFFCDKHRPSNLSFS